jgi:hypothetical protein
MTGFIRDLAARIASAKKQPLIILLTAVILTACSTTEDARRALNGKWLRKNSDDFVAQYGVPQSQYVRQDGKTILAWGSHESVYVPATTTTYGGYPIPIECSIQLTISKDHTIEKIEILEETSRCNELFN